MTKVCLMRDTALRTIAALADDVRP